MELLTTRAGTTSLLFLANREPMAWGPASKLFGGPIRGRLGHQPHAGDPGFEPLAEKLHVLSSCESPSIRRALAFRFLNIKATSPTRLPARV